MNFFNINQPLTLSNNSTKEYKRVEYQLSAAIKNSTNQNFHIPIESKHDYFLLSHTYLQVEFDVYTSATSDTRVKSSDRVALDTTWGLFRNLRLQMFNKQIDDSNTDDPATNVMLQTLPMASSDYQRSIQSAEGFYPMLSKCGEDEPEVMPSLTGVQPIGTHPLAAGVSTGDMLWYPYNDKMAPNQFGFIVKADTTKVEYTGAIRPNEFYDENFVRSNKDLQTRCSYMLPLRQVFPFLEQTMSRVNKGANLDFEFKAKSKAGMRDAFYVNGAALPELRVVFHKLSLWTVQMEPSDVTAAMLGSIYAGGRQPIERVFEQPYLTVKTNIDQNTKKGRVQISAKTARPIRAYVAFRYADAEAQNKNNHNFEGLNVEELNMRVGHQSYPSDHYYVDEHPMRILNDLHEMALKSTDYTDGSLVNRDNWTDGPCRIYGIDLSAISEDAFAKQVSDVELEYRLSDSPGKNYDVLVMVVSEKKLIQQIINSDGQMEIRL